jgi:hypothetical protein
MASLQATKAFTQSIKSRRLKTAGNSVKHPEMLASDLIILEPEAGNWDIRKSRPTQIYLNALLKY